MFPEENALPRTPLEEISENDENKQEQKNEPSIELATPSQSVRHSLLPGYHREHHSHDKSLASETGSTYSRERPWEPSHPKTQRQSSIRSLRSTSSKSREPNFFSTMLQTSPSGLQRQSSRGSMTMARSPGRDMGAPVSRSPRPLGPRPSFDVNSRRQRTLSEASNSSLTVSLPPGIRPRNPNRASKSGYSPNSKSNGDKCESPITNGKGLDTGGQFPPKFPSLPMGDLLSSYPSSYHSSMWPPPPGPMNSLQPMGRKLSASALSMRSTSSVASNGTTSTSVTPEKQRLMKALQHRKKMQEEEDRKERLKGKTVVDGDILKAENREPYTHYVAPKRTGKESNPE